MDRRFTGSTAVAAEGIEPSRRRVWAATVPSTSCGHGIRDRYRRRDLHPRSRFERPESWLLDDTDRTETTDKGLVVEDDRRPSRADDQSLLPGTLSREPYRQWARNELWPKPWRAIADATACCFAISVAGASLP